MRTRQACSAFAGGVALGLLVVASTGAQESTNVGALSGTLKKVRDTGAITLGYRESSLPFSYLNRRRQPIGYSLDLCREIVEDVSTELDGMEIKIAFTPVTPANGQCAAAKGSRVLANLLRGRHQADGS
jgi:ABC-type amino acid transport substrate-binding protein